MKYFNRGLMTFYAWHIVGLTLFPLLALSGCIPTKAADQFNQSSIVLSDSAKCGPSVFCDLPASIDVRVIEAYFDRLGEEGLSAVVLVAQGDNVVFSQAYGAARDEPCIVMTPDTLLDLGSISKQFTATLIMQLVDEERLSLDDIVSKFLPSVPDDKANITIHQLLTHTSGLTSHDTGNDFDSMTKAEAIERIFDIKLPFVPGEEFRYSNAGYTLLAIIAEEVTGEDYLPLIKNRLFEPAGMYHTATYGDDTLKQNPTAYGYRSEKETASFADAGPLQWGAMGNGEILTTVGDMHLWMHALRDGKIISTVSLEKMWAPSVSMGPPTIYYGYGWRIRTASRLGKRVEHGGAGHGGNANVSYFPEHDLLFIILSNRIGINFVDGEVLGVKVPAAQAAESFIQVIAENDPTIEADVSVNFLE